MALKAEVTALKKKWNPSVNKRVEFQKLPQKKRMEKHRESRINTEYKIMDVLSQSNMSTDELVNILGDHSKDEVLDILRWLIDSGEILSGDDEMLMLPSKNDKS